MKARNLMGALALAIVAIVFVPADAWTDDGNRLARLEGRLAAVEAENAALREQVVELKAAILPAATFGALVKVVEGEINGLGGPHLIIEGANLHVRSGSGQTNDNDALTGLGNLVIGYNESSGTPVLGRSGSHNLIVGRWHEYSSFGGLVAGSRNTISGPNCSVTGGAGNTASGYASGVGGGRWNLASTDYASVSGGYENTASGYASSVSGGASNEASGTSASVSGGYENTSSGSAASVGGGQWNVASTDYASVSGGYENTASGYASSVSGGRLNEASGISASVSGGYDNTASGDLASVSGGQLNEASGSYDWRGGSCYFCEQ